MKKHWSEVMACSCGMRFRSSAEEAKHRHNYPVLCRSKRKKTKAVCISAVPAKTEARS